jgi:L-iditol 2-dehydrogenase
MRMQAAQLIAPGRFELVEVERPEPRQGEVLVAMTRASICGSDLHAVLGTDPPPSSLPPGAPGHEGVGTVVSSRAAGFAPGDLVLTVPMPTSAGCYAQFQVVGADFLVGLPTDAPAWLVLAQQLGTVIFGFRRYWPDGLQAQGATAVVLGAGSAGLFFVQLARRAGFGRLVVCDLDERRLALASALGADLAVRAPGEDVVAAVLEVTDGAGADLVIEATGQDKRRHDSIEAVRYGGRIGFFGLPEHPGMVPFPLARAFRKAVTIEMAGNAQREPGLRSFKEAVAFIVNGEVDVSHLLQPTYPLERFQEAFEAARDHLGVKVHVDIGPIAI